MNYTVEMLKEMVQFRKPILGIKSILIHPNPHIDEIASVVVLQKYGEAHFPGISEAVVGWATQTQIKSVYDSEDGFYEILAQGTLVVSTAFGPFNDHGKKGLSCIKLITEYLGISKNPELQNLINYVHYTDTNGDRGLLEGTVPKEKDYLQKSAQMFLPGELLKTAMRVVDNDKTISEEEKDAQKCQYLGVYMDFIRLHIENQINFHTTKKEIQKSIQYVDLPRYDKKVLKAELAIITSNSDYAPKVARLFFGQRNVVAMLKISPTTGQFQIFTEKKGIPDVMWDVVKVIRTEEFRENKKFVPEWKLLVSEELSGSLIHFHKDAGSILNGSTTQRDVPGLVGKGRLFSEEELVDMVLLGLESKRLHSQHHNNCTKGVCAKNKCSLYLMGLSRCFEVRNNNTPSSTSHFNVLKNLDKVEE